MKKTNPPDNKAKRFMLLLACCAAFLFPYKIFAQSGISCASAISTSAHGELILDSTAYTSTWYSLVADSVDVQIEIFNQDTGATAISSTDMYSGSCASLTLLTATRVIGLHLVANYSGLTKGNTYYLKLTKSNSTLTRYTLAILNLKGLATSCGSCPANPNNTSINTCQAVCNGGFEYTSSGVTFTGQILLACPWDTTGIHYHYDSPDLFSTAVPSNIFGATVKVPNNAFGYQVPHHGNGYAGIITYSDYASTDREFLVQPLTVPMQAHKKYKVSYWVNLAGRSGYKASGIGVFLSNTNPNLLGPTSLAAQTPQIQGALYNTAISDTTNWVLISDTITPTTTINYIAIGSFQNDASDHHAAVGHTNWPNVMPINTAPWQEIKHYAYYFVDDVSIEPEGSITVSAVPNPPCNGDLVALTATSSIGNGYYSWTMNHAGTFTCNNANCDVIHSIVPNAYTSTLYTATTTLSNFGNCTISDSVLLTPLLGPYSVNAGTDQTICLGGSATLTGSVSSGNYNSTSWKISGGSTICSSCTTTTVSPTTTTYYVFTATLSSTGCTKTDTVKITVVPLTVNIVSQAGANTCSGCYNFTTALSYSTYAWSSNAISSSCSTCATFNACYNSSFSSPSAPITVTVHDAQGCIGTTTVYVPICCNYVNPEGITVPNIVNDSSTHIPTSHPGLFVWNATTQYYEDTMHAFVVNGTLIIDKDTRLRGCDVTFGPNAKIIVRPGIKFEITYNVGSFNTYTHLHAGCGAMWDGIYVDGTNSLSKVTVLNGSTIDDAKNAIVSTNGGNFVLDGTGAGGTVKLNKNNIGVLVKPYQGTHPGIIRKAIISCDSPTQPGGTNGVTASGANCIAPINGKAYAAIYIDSCSNITIGDSASNSNRNLMERQKFGVYSKNSNVKVWNNDLKYYLSTLIQKNPPIEGAAVYAKGNSALTRTLTVGRVGNYKAHNLIRKCTYGVVADSYMNLNCEYDRIDSITGIGVYSLNNQIGKTILINKDSITEFSGTGVNCTNVKQATVTITNNMLNETANSSPTSFAYTGIYVANAVNFTFSTVKIQANTIKRVRNGIWVMNVTSARIMDNPITFYVGQPMSVAMPAIGIKVEASHSTLIRNNTIAYNDATITTGSQLSTKYDKLFGIHLTNCINDTVTKNSVTKCGSGLFLKGSLNPFLNGCNNFITCYYGVNLGLSNSTQTSVSTSSQFRWVNPVTGTRTPTGDIWSNNNAIDIVGKASPSIGWYYNTASSSPQPANLSATTHLTIKDSAVTATNQCVALLSPVTISASEMRTALLSGICKTQRTYDTLNKQYCYWDSLYAFRMLRTNPSWLSLGTGDDSYYSNWYTAVGSTNIGKMANVEDSIKGNKLTGAISLLNSLTTHGTPEANRKTVLGIYLNTWAKDSMTLDSISIVTLTAIANYPPISGGPAVYDARAMLFLEVHDSSALRLAPETYYNNETSVPGHIYPNPSTGQLNLAYELPEGQTGTMQLYDISGRIVRSYPLVAGTPIQQFSASDVPNGLYFYMIIVGNEAVLSEKVVIIRQE